MSYQAKAQLGKRPAKFSRMVHVTPTGRVSIKKIKVHSNRKRKATFRELFNSLVDGDLAPQPPECDEPSSAESRPQATRSYAEKRRSSQEAWAKQREELLAQYVRTEVLPSTATCNISGCNSSPTCRCSDCGPAVYFCMKHAVATHQGKLHLPSFWKDGSFSPAFIKQEPWEPHALHQCSSQKERPIVVVDIKAQLHALRNVKRVGLHTGSPSLTNYADIPKEIKKRKRGKPGGVKRRIRRQKCKPFLPTIIMGNVQSLSNKIDELCANVNYLNEFRNASLMSFTETWLTEHHNDAHVSVNGFKLMRGDRTTDSGKEKGGGVCLYVNENWCHPNHATIKHHSCSTNVEILTVSLRPYYLPREFSHVIVCTVYVPHRSAAKLAALELCDVIHELETASPTHYSSSMGISIIVASGKDAYNSIQLPALGNADHNLINLLPKYRPIVQRQKPSTVTVQQWNEDSLEHLRAELDATDWNAFIDAAGDLDELTETIKVDPNNKPWITKRVKDVINRKKGLFGKGDHEGLKKIRSKLKRIIREERAAYKDKVEGHFTGGNMKRVWEGVRLMSGYNNKPKSCLLPRVDEDYANELNCFYNRFDRQDFSAEHDDFQQQFANSDCDITVTEDEVRRHLSRLHSSKAAGPDKLSPRVLKQCAIQLSNILTYIFNQSFTTRVIPNLWKQSCIIPVPKTSAISCLNDLRPVALTAVP
ncbi:hypothetical protein BSL78_23277 [Apostichopus japonicus]|uniref:RNA-directed DNA polymerase from mobile element jockey-like n=1 Tax=Stichopus japonicus TaxID=307972 RepID=A0A2G8JW30_STIJA|nr:hypothetical protein BSL78_23277 [Apostichopus japonicus]